MPRRGAPGGSSPYSKRLDIAAGIRQRRIEQSGQHRHLSALGAELETSVVYGAALSSCIQITARCIKVDHQTTKPGPPFVATLPAAIADRLPAFLSFLSFTHPVCPDLIRRIRLFGKRGKITALYTAALSMENNFGPKIDEVLPESGLRSGGVGEQVFRSQTPADIG